MAYAKQYRNIRQYNSFKLMASFSKSVGALVAAQANSNHIDLVASLHRLALLPTTTASHHLCGSGFPVINQ